MPDIQDPKMISLLGNMARLDPKKPVQTLMKLAAEHGGIFRLNIVEDLVVISSWDLAREVCDDARFDKKVFTALRELRTFAGDGLFTAFSEEENWSKAHRILLPAFGPASLRGMFEAMQDITEQMLTSWESLGDGQRLDVADNMTRLTLDTLALCAFNYRFNSFQARSMHPFVDAMVRGLEEAGARGRRPTLLTKLLLSARRRFRADARTMHDIADAVIAERRCGRSLPPRKDLLATMLEAKDPLTGEGLDDVNIRYQLVTFLIAGHETTSGLLSFALYELLKHPEVLRRAREEVDAVLGHSLPGFDDLRKLRYLGQVLKETLRLWPTAPAFGRSPRSPTVIDGRYRVRPGQVLLVLSPSLHRDPHIWADPEAFRPERMRGEALQSLPKHAWKPFGTGPRACIGSAFAMQEATLALASVLQRFDLEMADPNYKLDVKETLTLKPAGFYLNIRRRDRRTAKR